MKTLVVYYSRSGHTRQVAELLAEKLSADLQELVDSNSRKGLIGWLKSGRDAIKQRETELAPLDHRPEDYDLVVVGTPVWAAHPAPAVRTFLGSHDLGGKRVAFFCTMSARGGEETLAIMKELLSGGEPAGALAVAMKKQLTEEIRKQVDDWSSRLTGQN
jgi:flavodoxin